MKDWWLGVNSHHPATFRDVSCHSIYVWLVQNCTCPGRGVSSLLRAKGPVSQILVPHLGLAVSLSWHSSDTVTLGTKSFFLARRGNTFSAECRTHENEDLSETGGKPTANNSINLNSILFSTKACISINEFLQEWVAQEGPQIIFLCIWRAVKRVLKFQVNFSEVSKVLSSNDGSNYIQIRLQVFQPCHLHNTVLHVDQPLRDKPLKMAFGSSEKPW